MNHFSHTHQRGNISLKKKEQNYFRTPAAEVMISKQPLDVLKSTLTAVLSVDGGFSIGRQC
jgi:hypothetical protein